MANRNRRLEISGFAPGKKGFNSPLQGRPFQENIVLTLEAFDTDIGAQTHHYPLITSARVWLFQPQDVADS
jgi:hypothetical protein